LKPRAIELRPPNILKLGRRCDLATIHHWLLIRNFRSKS
jgi:hypothetical protein